MGQSAQPPPSAGAGMPTSGPYTAPGAPGAGGNPFANFGGKSARPPPVNPTDAAQQQFKSGQESINQQTQANRPNQTSTFGGIQWTKDPNTGAWTQTTSLNGPLAGAAGNLQSQAATNAATGPQNIQDVANKAIQANYSQATSRLDPQWNLQQEQLQTQLANQGIPPGSAAYQQAMDEFSRSKNDAYTSAMNNAIAQGNQTEQVQLGAQMAPYQQMGALQGLQGQQGFNAAGAYDPLQSLSAAGMYNNYDLQEQNMQNQLWGDALGAIGNVGGAAMKLSDARVKEDIERLPVEAHPGVPLATFKYKHAPEKGHQLGVIAQDVEKVLPGAVHTNEAGIKAVDYAQLKPFGFGGKKNGR